MFDTLPQIKTEHVSSSVTGHIPSSSKGKTGKKTVIEDVEDDIDELPDSDFSRATVRLFYEIDNVKAGLLPSSKFGDLIEIIGVGFHSEDLAGQLRKVDSNESGSLDHFSFVMCYEELCSIPPPMLGLDAIILKGRKKYPKRQRTGSEEIAAGADW